VKWQGWPSSYNQWEPEEHLVGAPLKLSEFRGAEETPRRKRSRGNVTST
jgi:hypothetical protein